MARCQWVHDLRQCPVNVGSPQTVPQRDQVTRIISRLMTQSTFLRRTISDVSLTEHPSLPSPSRSPRSGPTTPLNNRKKVSSIEGTESDEINTSRSIHLHIEPTVNENINTFPNNHDKISTPSVQSSSSSQFTKTPSTDNSDPNKKQHDDKMNVVVDSNQKNIQIPYEPPKTTTTTPHTNNTQSTSSISSSFLGALKNFRVTGKGTT